MPEARVFFPSPSFIFPNNSLQKSALLLCPLYYFSLSLSQLFLLLIRSNRNDTQLSIPEPRRQEEVIFFLEIYMEELLSCYLYLVSYIIKCIYHILMSVKHLRKMVATILCLLFNYLTNVYWRPAMCQKKLSMKEIKRRVWFLSTWSYMFGAM